MKRLLLLLLGVQALSASAQEPLRDPTQAPAAARLAGLPASEAGSAGTSTEPQHIMVLNGRPYLIVAGRRLGVGDPLGGARITRIGDGAVWLKEGGVTRRLSLYAGVEKRPAGTEGAAARIHMAPPKNNKEQP